MLFKSRSPKTYARFKYRRFARVARNRLYVRSHSTRFVFILYLRIPNLIKNGTRTAALRRRGEAESGPGRSAITAPARHKRLFYAAGGEKITGNAGEKCKVIG